MPIDLLLKMRWPDVDINCLNDPVRRFEDPKTWGMQLYSITGTGAHGNAIRSVSEAAGGNRVVKIFANLTRTYGSVYTHDSVCITMEGKRMEFQEFCRMCDKMMHCTAPHENCCSPCIFPYSSISSGADDLPEAP